MEGNMHRARSSKEMQYVEKSCWDNFVLHLSKARVYGWEQAVSLVSRLNTPDRRNQVGHTGGTFTMKLSVEKTEAGFIRCLVMNIKVPHSDQSPVIHIKQRLPTSVCTK